MTEKMPGKEILRLPDGLLVPDEVIMDKFYYDSPQKMRDYFKSYVESIKKGKRERDNPEKFARDSIEGFLVDFEDGIKAWRKILAENVPEEEK